MDRCGRCFRGLEFSAECKWDTWEWNGIWVVLPVSSSRQSCCLQWSHGGKRKKQLCFPVNKAESLRSPQSSSCSLPLSQTLHIIWHLMFSSVYQLMLSESNIFPSRQKADNQKPNMLIIHLCLVFHENEPMRSIISVGSVRLWRSCLFPSCSSAGAGRGSSRYLEGRELLLCFSMNGHFNKRRGEVSLLG